MILPARYRPTANIAFKVFKFCIKLVTSFASEFATRNVNSAKTACIRSHTRKTYLHNTHDDISGQSFDHEGGQRAANWDDSARCFESIDYRRRTRYRNFHGSRNSEKSRPTFLNRIVPYSRGESSETGFLATRFTRGISEEGTGRGLDDRFAFSSPRGNGQILVTRPLIDRRKL